TFSNLIPGAGYMVGETVPAGWQQTGATCDNGNAVGSITLATGATVTCTFTNTKLSNLVVQKTTLGGTGTFDFSGTGGISPTFSLTTSAPNTPAGVTFSNLTPGAYTVAETVPTGWQLTSATCDNGSAIGSINLLAGTTVTCLFTDTKKSNLVIQKNTAGGD